MTYLLVGQGIAGSMLAWTLRRRGAAVHLADAGFPHRSSDIAAGIINPVTGKRFVKSWRFDAFYPAALAAYHAMKAEWGVRIWHEQPILRFLENAQEHNDWSLRMADPAYADLLDERSDAGAWSELLAPAIGLGHIRKAGRADLPLILRHVKETAVSEGRFFAETLPYEQAEARLGQYDGIIWCEGYRGAQNPFFPGLPWQLAKGEALLIGIDHPKADAAAEMIKKNVIAVPLGERLFWVGGSYNWTFEDNGPTAAEQEFLETRLATMLHAPYRVVRRMGGVRPTVKDRRPFLGASPVRPGMYIFNGLGTKGALLAPYWAAHLAAHLLDGTPMDPSVDIRRFNTENP
ncbi:MAG: FAD-binding oxidoreductase [Saprospirales bacterium]|nr:FAD-binding oxidoreductase [Saprospirales bacterium]